MGGTDHQGIELGLPFLELGGVGIDFGNDPLGIHIVLFLVEISFLPLLFLPLVLLFEIVDKIPGTAPKIVPQLLACDGDVHVIGF